MMPTAAQHPAEGAKDGDQCDGHADPGSIYLPIPAPVRLLVRV